MASSSNKRKGKKSTPKHKQISKPSFWQQKELLLPLAISLVATIIAFFPSLGNEFVNWDDDVNILDNQYINSLSWESIKGIFTTDIIGGYNPLSIFTFALENAIFGLNPQVMHINNLILHLICVYFVYRIMLELNISKAGVLLVTLLFGIHPMRVESVAWITERKDVLFGAFYLAAFFQYVLYLKGNRKEKKRLYVIMVLFILSLLSKIQAVSLPLSMLALDYYFKRPLKFNLILEKAGYFLAAFIVGLMGIYFLSDEGSLDEGTTFTFIERLFIGAYSLFVYCVKFIFPYEMSPLYPYPDNLDWYFYPSPLFGLGMLAWLFWAFKKDYRGQVFGLLFFLVNVVFVLQILGAGQGFLADRFTYIPYIGLFFLLALGYDYLVDKKPLFKKYLQIGGVAYLLLFAGMTFQQCKIWKNGGTLWTHVLKYHNNTTLPYANRARFYREQELTEQALKDYDSAIRLKPKATLYNSRGKLYFDKGQIANSIEDYSRGIELDNTIGEIYANRGAAYASSGQHQLALQDLNKSIELDASNKNAYLNRSLLHYQSQQFDLAIKDHTAYLDIDPTNPNIWYERGLSKRILGRFQEAINDFNEAIRRNNTNGLYYLERSRANLGAGNKAQALQDARQAQNLGREVDPAYLEQLK